MAEHSSTDFQLYDSWDLARPVITPRAHLYHLKPIGLGTSRTESFTSYLARLANAHCLTLYGLFHHELIPKSGQFLSAIVTTSSSTDFRIGDLSDLTAINGRGQVAQTWVAIIEHLTRQRNLSLLTMLPWQAVLANRLLLRRVRAWCPICLDEQMRKKTIIYEHLTWALASINVCVDHGINLQTKCPHCQRISPPFDLKLSPGYCSDCLGWLGCTRSGTRQAVVVNQYEVWVANQLAQLIATSYGLDSRLTPERLSNFLRICVNQGCDGNASAFYRFLGISERTHRDWRSLRILPDINLLLRVCHRTSIGLVTLLTCDFTNSKVIMRLTRMVGPSDSRRLNERFRNALLTALEEERPPSVSVVAQRLGLKRVSPLYVNHAKLCRTLTAKYWKARSTRAPRPKKRLHLPPSVIKAALQAALDEKPRPCLLAVARRLGYLSSNSLRHQFPGLCRMLVSRSLQAKNALEDALLQPLPPSLVQIAQTLGYAQSGSLSDYYPELCEKIIARREEYRIQQRNQIRSLLESMLLENPPPTMKEAAKRLGYKSFESRKFSLLRYFPDQCAAIKLRFEQHRTLMRQRLAQLINDALRENPPPSLRDVFGRTGYSCAYMSLTFPVQREVIKTRYRKFQKNLAAQRKAETKSRIKQLALQLYRAGIYPAPKEISKACDGRIGMTTGELMAVLREVRLEVGIKFTEWKG